MGFVDISGSTGRRFGSIGLTLDRLGTLLEMHESDELIAEGPQADRALCYVRRFAEILDISPNIRVAIDTAIPEHAGLGSGTQMAMAIGTALCRLRGMEFDLTAIAKMANRGVRSGIGIAAFNGGGFIIDGGRSEGVRVPPIIVRLDVPEDWRFILVFDKSREGLHGDQELRAFDDLPTFPPQEAARLCQNILMQALPSLVENDIKGFGQVITGLQETVGDYFAAAQGGRRYTSLGVEEVVNWLGDQGGVALGQSSWGPTGFCLLEGEQRAEQLAQAARREFADKPELSFRVVKARNRGARIDIEPTASAVFGRERKLYAS